MRKSSLSIVLGTNLCVCLTFIPLSLKPVTPEIPSHKCRAPLYQSYETKIKLFPEISTLKSMIFENILYMYL